MRILLCSCLVLLAVVIGCMTVPETGRQAFVLTSEDQEAQLGAQAYQEVLQKEKVSSNARWKNILQRVGERIAVASGHMDYKWQFRLIESNQQNAFCLPGGKVAFYTGIFPIAQTEAGLAVVMGHEVAHATARHAGQRISLALGTELGLAGLQALIGGQDSRDKRLLMGALGLGVLVGATLPFSRANEAEADEIGLVYMARAGYDPRVAPEFWSRFAASSGGGPSFLSTHPSSSSRMQSLERQMSKVLPLYERSPLYGKGETL